MKKHYIHAMLVCMALLAGIIAGCDNGKKEGGNGDKPATTETATTTTVTTTPTVTATPVDSFVLANKTGTMQWRLVRTDTNIQTWCRYYCAAATEGCTDLDDATICIVCANEDFPCNTDKVPNNFNLTQTTATGRTCVYTVTRVGNPCEQCRPKEGANPHKLHKFKAIKK